jgi:hypothetical protein
MRTCGVAALLTLVLTGCAVGPSPRSFLPATRPAGIAMEIVSVQRARMTGELLEVQDTALLVLADSQVRLAPYKAINSAAFHQRGDLSVGWTRTPGRSQREELRRLARFPAGAPPEALRRLLQICGQVEPKVVQ